MKISKAIEKIKPKMVLEFGKVQPWMNHLLTPPTEGEKVLVVATHFDNPDPIRRQCITIKRKHGVETFFVEHFRLPLKKTA